MIRGIISLVPVLRINNRQVNQEFFEKNLGFKTKLEEGAYTELGDTQTSDVKLILVESPSMRTRAVQGLKKLGKIIVRVEQAKEIEALLARGAQFTKLFKGQAGYAFESISPEGDCFLLHAETDWTHLVEILPPQTFETQAGFEKVTAFQMEGIVVHTPQPTVSEAFYAGVFGAHPWIHFQEAEGEDLLAPVETVWDLDGFQFQLPAASDWESLEESLTRPFFKDKRGRFLQTTDPSGLELWFEK